MRGLCLPLVHHFDGIGETSTHYIDLAASDLAPAVPESSFGSKLAARLRFESAALPYALGIKKACAGFRHLGRGPKEVPA
jgi:hypothetical protein